MPVCLQPVIFSSVRQSVNFGHWIYAPHPQHVEGGNNFYKVKTTNGYYGVTTYDFQDGALWIETFRREKDAEGNLLETLTYEGDPFEMSETLTVAATEDETTFPAWNYEITTRTTLTLLPDGSVEAVYYTRVAYSGGDGFWVDAGSYVYDSDTEGGIPWESIPGPYADPPYPFTVYFSGEYTYSHAPALIPETTVTYSEPYTIAHLIDELALENWSGGLFNTFLAAASQFEGVTAVRHRFAVPSAHQGSKFFITYDIAEFPDEGEPSLVSEDNVIDWNGPGSGIEDDPSWLTDWVEIVPPSVPGQRRIVNIRYSCYSGIKYGVKPQIMGESFP
jgi:hypothetical protein